MINETKTIKTNALIILKIFLIYFCIQACVGASDSVETSGDLLQILIPAIAFSTEVINYGAENDDFYKSFATNLVVTHALKMSISKERPDGGDKNSFPSGHTSAAFQGAAYIHKRYGMKKAIPVYMGATFVGYSRVQADKHDVKDVLAGAVIGFISSYYSENAIKDFKVKPSVNEQSIGIKLSRSW